VTRGRERDRRLRRGGDGATTSLFVREQARTNANKHLPSRLSRLARVAASTLRIARRFRDRRTHARTQACTHTHTRTQTDARGTLNRHLDPGEVRFGDDEAGFSHHPRSRLSCGVRIPRRRHSDAIAHFRDFTSATSKQQRRCLFEAQTRSLFAESDTDRWPSITAARRASSRVCSGSRLSHSLTLLLFLFPLSARDLWPLIRRRSFYHIRRDVRARALAAHTRGAATNATRAHDVHERAFKRTAFAARKDARRRR